MKNLLCFGLGYVANHLMYNLNQYDIVSTTSKDIANHKSRIIKFDDLEFISKDTTHILVSIPPGNTGDIVYDKFCGQIIKLKNLVWLGYLSSTGVYGDYKGEWVDENSATHPTNERTKNRLIAEKKWLSLHQDYNVPTVIYRLAGIYGKGRNPLEKILQGENIPIINAKNKFFSRIYIKDLTNILKISMKKVTPGEIYNIADDLPCESSKVTEYAYKLADRIPTKHCLLEDTSISPILKEFYQDNKKVNNQKVKNLIESQLQYPTYVEGLNAIKKLL